MFAAEVTRYLLQDIKNSLCLGALRLEQGLVRIFGAKDSGLQQANNISFGSLIVSCRVWLDEECVTSPLLKESLLLSMPNCIEIGNWVVAQLVTNEWNNALDSGTANKVEFLGDLCNWLRS